MNPDDVQIDWGKMFSEVLDSAGTDDEKIKVTEWIHAAGQAMGQEGYDLNELLQDAWEDDSPDVPPGDTKFDDNPEVECVNNLGIEEFFDVGVTYVADYLDSDFFKVYDRFGNVHEVMRERFKEVV